MDGTVEFVAIPRHVRDALIRRLQLAKWREADAERAVTELDAMLNACRARGTDDLSNCYIEDQGMGVLCRG
jgi:hypothetical protein